MQNCDGNERRGKTVWAPIFRRVRRNKSRAMPAFVRKYNACRNPDFLTAERVLRAEIHRNETDCSCPIFAAEK